MAFFEIQSRGETSRHELSDVVLLGRSADADLVLDDPKASREHCRVEFRRNAWRITDLASGNGTRVNGSDVSSVLLRNGDEILIGNVTLVFHAERMVSVHSSSQSGLGDLDPENVGRGRTVRRRNSSLVIIGAVFVLGLVLVLPFIGSGEEGRPDRLEQMKLAEQEVKEAQRLEGTGDLEAALAVYRGVVALNLKTPAGEVAREKSDKIEGTLAARKRDREEFEHIRGDVEDRNFREVERVLARIVADTDDRVLSFEVSAFLSSVSALRDRELGTRFSAVSLEAAGFERDGSWSQALDLLDGFVIEAMSSGFGDYEIRARRRKLDVLVKARTDFEGLEREVDDLVGLGDLVKARDQLGVSLNRFRRTNFEALARARIQTLAVREAVAKWSAGRERALEEAGRTNAPPVVDRKRELAEKGLAVIEQAEKDAIARNWRVAAGAYGTLIDSMDGSVEGLKWAERHASLLALAGLKDLFIARVVSGKRMGRIRVGRFSATVQEADQETVRLQVGRTGNVSWAWKEIPTDSLLTLLELPVSEPRQRVDLAVVHHALGREESAREILLKVASRKPVKREVDMVFARWRGIDVPAGGFLLVDGGLYTPAEAHDIELRKKASRLVRSVANAGFESFREALSSLEEMGEAVEPVLEEALLARRAASFGRLGNHPSIKKIPRTRAVLNPILEERRKKALALIFDSRRYPYPYAPNQSEIQAEVNGLVDAVREIYDTPTQYLLANLESFRAARDEVVELDRRLARFGGKTEDLGAMFAEMDRRIDMPTHSWSPANLKYAREVAQFNDEIDSSVTADERECYDATNEYRMMMGRRPVKIEETLLLGARSHSQEMHDLKYFSHTSPTKGRERPSQRVQLNGWGGGCSENIAQGQKSGKSVLRSWVNSSGHHRNILGGWSVLGCGKSVPGFYWTQNFAKGGSTSLSKKKKKKEAPK